MAFERREVIPEPSEYWHDRAACRGVGPDDFFAEEHGSYGRLRWRSLCNGCEVRGDCLAFSLLCDERWGVWGGFTPNARKALLSQLLEETMTWRHLLQCFEP
jgi:WhiB family redox-sensing transcriptional regulator